MIESIDDKKRDRFYIYAAAAARSVGVSFLSVIFGLYLAERNMGPAQIGILVGMGLGANALATFFVSFGAERFGRKKTLLTLTLMAAFGAVFLAFAVDFMGLMLASSLGLVNAMGRDRGPCASLDQSILPSTTTSEKRTWTFAVYNVALDIGHASGSLLAMLPSVLKRNFYFSQLASYQSGLFFYAGLLLLSFFFYLRLAGKLLPVKKISKIEISAESKKIISKISLLFAIDSLGSGFLTNALISYWFFKRFGVREEMLGPIFFAVHLASGISHFAAAWLSKKIGLINTMVFTHIPSSLFLLTIPFASSLPVAAGLFVLRASLLEMDVPVRQSYVMAVVREEERTFASGVTGFTRLVGWTAGPFFAGALMKGLSLSTPLFIGGGLKIIYDLLLFKLFRHRKAPEESSRNENS